MPKKSYPGGFRLTLKTARALAVQEFGAAKGMKQSDWANSEGFYVMTPPVGYYIKDNLWAEMDKP